MPCVAKPIAHYRRSIRVLERPAEPVVHDLDDGKPLVEPPDDFAVRSRRIVVGAEHRHVMAPGQLAPERQRINLRTRLVSRQEIVDRVQQAEGGHL